jgi:hypothetical protein
MKLNYYDSELLMESHCVCFPGNGNYNLEMHKSLVLLLAFPMAALVYQLKFNTSSTGNYWLYNVTNFLSLYSLLDAARVSSIPIVDENDSLLDTHCWMQLE